jgi:alpha-tubulin suppressor-like RCC1 family protein
MCGEVPQLDQSKKVAHKNALMWLPIQDAQGGLLTSVMKVSAGLHHFAAITDAGDLFMWGKGPSSAVA